MLFFVAHFKGPYYISTTFTYLQSQHLTGEREAGFCLFTTVSKSYQFLHCKTRWFQMSTLKFGEDESHFDEHILSNGLNIHNHLQKAGISAISSQQKSPRSHWTNFILFTLFSHLEDVEVFSWYDVDDLWSKAVLQKGKDMNIWYQLR